MCVFTESISKYGELDETATDEFEELHKAMIKEPLQLCSNAQQTAAIFENYNRMHLSRPYEIQSLNDKLKNIPPPLSSPVCSLPKQKPTHTQINFILSVSVNSNSTFVEEDMQNIFVHNSAKLISFQNSKLTPYAKIRASNSYYNSSQFNFIQYQLDNHLHYGRIDLIFSLHTLGYCVLKNLEIQASEGSTQLNTNLYSFTDQLIIPLENVLSVVHFVPDASIDQKGRLHINEGRYWFNPTATSF